MGWLWFFSIAVITAIVVLALVPKTKAGTRRVLRRSRTRIRLFGGWLKGHLPTVVSGWPRDDREAWLTLGVGYAVLIGIAFLLALVSWWFTVAGIGLVALAMTDSFVIVDTYETVLVTFLGGRPSRNGKGLKPGFHPKLPRPLEIVKPEHRRSLQTFSVRFEDDFESGGSRCWGDIPRYAATKGDTVKRIDNVPTSFLAEFRVVPEKLWTHLQFPDFLESVRERLHSMVQEVFVKYANRPTILASIKEIEDEIRKYIVGVRFVKNAAGDDIEEEKLPDPDEDLLEYYGVTLLTLQLSGTKVPEVVREARDQAEAATARAQKRQTDLTSLRKEAMEVLKLAGYTPKAKNPKKRPTKEMVEAVVEQLMVQDGTIPKNISIKGLDKGTLATMPEIVAVLQAFVATMRGKE